MLKYGLKFIMDVCISGDSRTNPAIICVNVQKLNKLWVGRTYNKKPQKDPIPLKG